jgi:hypothetical protein
MGVLHAFFRAVRSATWPHFGTSVVQYVYTLFAHDLKLFCRLLLSDIDSVQKWCIENCMKRNILKINMTSLTRKTDSLHFNYFLGDILNVRFDHVKELGVMLDSKLHFHRHVDHLCSEILKL